MAIIPGYQDVLYDKNIFFSRIRLMSHPFLYTSVYIVTVCYEHNKQIYFIFGISRLLDVSNINVLRRQTTPSPIHSFPLQYILWSSIKNLRHHGTCLLYNYSLRLGIVLMIFVHYILSVSCLRKYLHRIYLLNLTRFAIYFYFITLLLETF